MILTRIMMEHLGQLRDLHATAVKKHGEYIAAELALQNESESTPTPDEKFLKDMLAKKAEWTKADNEFIELVELIIKSLE